MFSTVSIVLFFGKDIRDYVFSKESNLTKYFYVFSEKDKS